MTRNQIIDVFINSNLIEKWHWFTYHFSFYKIGLEHPFAKSIIDAIYEISLKNEKAASDFINKLININGKEKDFDHYDQLMQVLSEILILKEALNYPWNSIQCFDYEPVIGTTKKNPELNIITSDFILGIEVKSPSLIKFQKLRQSELFQLTSRTPLIDILKDEKKILPKDNSVKDFLNSANEKFEGFKAIYPNYISLLFIVWDDFINEPISAILSEPHGLFMQDSFAKDSNGNNLNFENVDYVAISRHRLQFQQFAGERPHIDPINHALDYGRKDIFPFKITTTFTRINLLILNH